MQVCKLIITSLTPPLFIEVPIPIQWAIMHLCIGGIRFVLDLDI